MVEWLLQALLVQTLTLSIAVVGARVVQAAIARRLGVGAAYLCWLLVPVATLAVALPHAASDALVLRVDVSELAPALARAAPARRVVDGGVLASLLALGWCAGALGLAVVLALAQRRFVSTIAGSIGSGPAVIGVFRPRVALPRDFDTAFDAEERRLMLLHEGVHLRRCDNAWNLLASALLVAHWFNPVAWWAWRRLRADQELACDAAVLRGEPPEVLATYAGALLKVQGVAMTPPLATAWRSTHPLVERVRMLPVHRISPARHRAGLRVAALSMVVAGLGGHALRADADGASAAGSGKSASVMTAITVTHTTTHVTAPDVTNKTTLDSSLRVLCRIGEPAVIRFGDGEHAAPFEIVLTVSRLDAGLLQVDTRLSAGSPLKPVGAPRVIVRDGETAGVSVDAGEALGAFSLSLTPKVVEGVLPEPPQRAP